MNSCWIVTERGPYGDEDILFVASSEEVADDLVEQYVGELNHELKQRYAGDPEYKGYWRKGVLCQWDDEFECWNDGCQAIVVQEWEVK